MTLRPFAIAGWLIAATCGALGLSHLTGPQNPGPEPVVAQPVVAKPVVAKPVVAQSVVAQAAADAGAVPPISIATAPSAPTTDARDAKAADSEASRVESGLPESGQIETPQVETPKVETPQVETTLAALAPAAAPVPAKPRPDIAAPADPAAVVPTAKASLEAQGVGPVKDPVTRLTVRAERGDTLARLLVEAGVSRGDTQAVVDSMNKVFDPRDLKPGHELELRFLPDQDEDGTLRPLGRLQGLQFAFASDRDVEVRADPEGGFVAAAFAKQVLRRLARNDGEIVGGSLLAAGMSSGVPAGVMTEMIRIFSFDVDFQRDIQPGDRFDLMYERFHLADGRLVRGGDVMYAALTLSGKTMRLYRYKDSGGRVDYYNELGHSVRKALLRTPIDGAKLTSRFGMRDHPILGYTVMHRGVDFGAPSGTPIFAAGEGAIADLGVRNGYGRYIRIRHNGSYSTAYAHLSGYARGLKPGARVRQGQVIGYVGMTGRATGPHLHYEVIRDGKQVNPVTVKFPTGEKLAGQELQRFLQIKADLDRTLPSAQMASEQPRPNPIGAGR